jgi:chorismate synthase
MNSFGRIFRVSIFGESHGINVGIVIDGCPAGIPIKTEDFIPDLSRRKSGAKGTTPRTEDDLPVIVSGVFQDHTTGAPITILFENNNTRSRDYTELFDVPRPGHADFVARKKYGEFNDYRGGGHFSGRITTGIVAAGVLAKKILDPIIVKANLVEVGGNKNIDKAIDEAMAEGDSVGGLIECTVQNMTLGLGEPFFDSVESMISHIIFAIPATKGIEFGSGFGAAKMRGSENNDCFIDTDGKTTTNNAGGINGGISNGNDLFFKVAVKPTSSIHLAQNTINLQTGEMTNLQVEGRHDTCIALRIPIVIEAATAIALADLNILEQQTPRVAKNL